MKPRYKNVMTMFGVAVLAIGLAACGGGGSKTPAPEPPPPPTTVEMAMDAIAAAETVEDAQAAYDAVKDEVTATEGDMLQAAVDERVAALMTMARAAAQRMALMEAADGVDTSNLMTQEDIDAAEMAIAALQAAIDAADDVDDTSMYESQVTAANMDVATAQANVDTQGRMEMQRTALTSASTALETALDGISADEPTQAQIDAAKSALADLNTAITGAEDLGSDETGPYSIEAANAMGQISVAEKVLMANNEAAEEEQRKADEAARMAMAATAAKLHAGIYVQAADASGTDEGDVHAAYNDAGNPTGSAADSHIIVTIGDGTTANGQALSEDKDAMVAALYGWEGKGYTASGTDVDGTYEAQVYSHIGEPMEGNKFGSPADDDDYQYTLDAADSTELTMDDTNADAGWAERVASPSFDQSAGVKEFERGNRLRVEIAGTYHGVSGTYYCTPAAASTCAAQVAAEGFTLGGTADDGNAFTTAGGVWTFKPGNREARVMSMPDGSYASYGWWLHTAENGDLTASAFVDRVGAAEAASGLTALNGTATYMGGAAGKYALTSTTGGTNDAGHFTARATLEANFTDNEITGTIDRFMGGDGMSRDWSVELKESMIGDTGILNTTGADGGAGAETVWTIGGTDADDSGSWAGSLQENGDDGVPGIATGTFYSEYGTAGKMVGAFGANKQ